MNFVIIFVFLVNIALVSIILQLNNFKQKAIKLLTGIVLNLWFELSAVSILIIFFFQFMNMGCLFIYFHLQFLLLMSYFSVYKLLTFFFKFIPKNLFFLMPLRYFFLLYSLFLHIIKLSYVSWFLSYNFLEFLLLGAVFWHFLYVRSCLPCSL